MAQQGGNSEVILEGYLQKKGSSFFSTYSTRYFRLMQNVLLYFTKNTDPTPKGSIPLTDIEKVHYSGQMFFIKTNVKETTLKTTPELARQWADVIDHHRQKARRSASETLQAKGGPPGKAYPAPPGGDPGMQHQMHQVHRMQGDAPSMQEAPPPGGPPGMGPPPSDSAGIGAPGTSKSSMSVPKGMAPLTPAPKGMAGASCSPLGRATAASGGYATQPMGGPPVGGPPMCGPPIGGFSTGCASPMSGLPAIGASPAVGSVHGSPAYMAPSAVTEDLDPLFKELWNKLNNHRLITDANQKDAQVEAVRTLVALLDEAQALCGKIEVAVKEETKEQGEILGKMQQMVARDNQIKQDIASKKAQLEQIEREKTAKEQHYMKMLEAAPTLAHVLKKRGPM